MLFLENPYKKEFEAKILNINNNQIILDQTIFYARSGGQPGDIGTLYNNNNKKVVKVLDTIKDQNNNIIHICDEVIEFKNNENIKGNIDWNLRYKHMRMHSALHLLCSVIPFGVTGGQINYNKSRLDFDAKNNQIIKEQIQESVNNLVNENIQIDYQWITTDELDKKPELVRTMSVKPPKINGKIRLVKIGNVDIQPCGGTHVKSTKENGKISIIKIENKGKKNRRINIVLD